MYGILARPRIKAAPHIYCRAYKNGGGGGHICTGASKKKYGIFAAYELKLI